MPRTGFTSKHHGFHFPNHFINYVGNFFGKDITTRGRCGGMAYASLDYYFAGLPIPTHVPSDFPNKEVPDDQSELAMYILLRLLHSFSVLSALKFIDWTLISDNDTWFYDGVETRTRNDEFPKIRQKLDAGMPVVLGLVNSRSLSDIGREDHQVVAYGYDFDANNTIKLYVYDNNHPDEEVVLFSPPRTHITSSPYGEIYRGFFLQDYSVVAPTYKELAIIQGLSISRPVPIVGHSLRCAFRVKNYGDYVAHVQYLYQYVRGPSGEILDYFLGSDDDGRPLQPREERDMTKVSDHFGTVTGRYTISAGYRWQDEWYELPAGEPNTQGRLDTIVQAARINISVSPSPIIAGEPTKITVHAEDMDLNQPVQGRIQVGNVIIGETDVPFTTTFHATTVGILVTPWFPLVAFSFNVLLKKLVVQAAPDIVQLGIPVPITIYAKDEKSGQPVSGQVLVIEEGGPIVSPSTYSTNKEFTHSFRKYAHVVKRCPEAHRHRKIIRSRLIGDGDGDGDGDPPIEPCENDIVEVPPRVKVVATDYEETEVKIVFNDN